MEPGTPMRNGDVVPIITWPEAAAMYFQVCGAVQVQAQVPHTSPS